MTKELIFSSNIGQHDLDTKSKQIQQWIEKKYHVQVTIKKGKNADQPGNEPVSRCEHQLGLCSPVQKYNCREIGRLQAKKLTSNYHRVWYQLPGVKLYTYYMFSIIM